MIGSLEPLLRWRFGGEAFPVLSKNYSGGDAMSSLYVGIDVSKDASSAQGIDAKGSKVFYLSLTMNAQGFSDLSGQSR